MLSEPEIYNYDLTENTNRVWESLWYSTLSNYPGELVTIFTLIHGFRFAAMLRGSRAVMTPLIPQEYRT